MRLKSSSSARPLPPLALVPLAAILLVACSDQSAPTIEPPAATASTEATTAVQNASAITGQVSSSAGPEAGVWVIAETGEFDTFFARIVATDEEGRFAIPDLPAASYQVWVRGYGLADSAKFSADPGESLQIAATLAPNDAVAAQVYPAAYWYSMMGLPDEGELGNIEGGLNAYLTWMKNMGCVGCHQLGQQSTRTIPEFFGEFETHEQAWMRRVLSGQAGQGMFSQLSERLDGVPFKYLGDWTQRIADGELPFAKPQRPSGQERNVVVTVRDWSNPRAYMHDLSGTDRRDPTVNANGPLYGAPELSTDEFPVLDPVNNTSWVINAPVRDADTPTTAATPPSAPTPYW
ncbi:MAG: carboxypeptidase-like regulatory domain-containing protein, partial [Proteobacteria bacterium]|nr:carboxypeptidase-like regulatory domain-containing protein [Pseudomonadota bacterium]